MKLSALLSQLEAVQKQLPPGTDPVLTVRDANGHVVEAEFWVTHQSYLNKEGQRKVDPMLEFSPQ